MGTPMSGICRR